MCFPCFWATFVLLQPGSLPDGIRQGASVPFLRRTLLIHLWCDLPVKFPSQMQRSHCYCSMRWKHFQCCLNMLFRSVARKMATWIRRVGRERKSLDSTLPSPANVGIFSADAEAWLEQEHAFNVLCSWCGGVAGAGLTMNQWAAKTDRPCLCHSLSAPRSSWVQELISERERTKSPPYLSRKQDISGWLAWVHPSWVNEPPEGGFTEACSSWCCNHWQLGGYSHSSNGHVVPSALEQLQGSSAEFIHQGLSVLGQPWAGGLSVLVGNPWKYPTGQGSARHSVSLPKGSSLNLPSAL